MAFFDTLAAMGGADRVDSWVAQGLAYRDRVHFTRAGYERWADLLVLDLLTGYDAWRVHTHLER